MQHWEKFFEACKTSYKSSHSYGRSCLKSKDLRIESRQNGLDKSFSLQILIHPVTRVAYGVEYVRNGKVQIARATKEVILSGGSIGSAQILMLSGIGPKEHLQQLKIPVLQDLRVGHNLQDHVGVGGLTFMVNQEVSIVQNRYENLPTVLRYAMFGDGPLTVLGGVEGIKKFLKHLRNILKKIACF